MNLKLFMLLCMVFLHIVDDYYLQGCLANFKRKDWWKENTPDKLYQNDYLIALIMHGFSWSFMVHIPTFIYSYLYKNNLFNIMIISVILHALVHAMIDYVKANLKIINLIDDQALHLMQIVSVWCIVSEVLI